jgi:hypothetical protein
MQRGLPLRRVLAAAGLTLLICCAGSKQARAELLIGLTENNLLIRFDSATPGTVNTIGLITGLTPGDVLAGMDRRPSTGPNNGLIYALGISQVNGAARIYILNETNAVATLVSTLTADPSDSTPPFPFTLIQSPDGIGMDFDPVTERLRIITDIDQNYRVNVDNGLTQLDVPTAYQPGDPGFGTDAILIGAAYANNFGGAPSTTLRAIDVNKGPDRLVTFTDPNNGLFQSSAVLPFDAPSINTAYDISGLTGTGYFVRSAGSPELYRSTPAGAELVGFIGSPAPVRGLAAPVGTPVGGQAAAPEPTPSALAALVALPALILFRSAIARRRRTP